MNKAQQYKQEWADARQACIEAQHEQDRLDELEGYSLYEDILLQEHEEQLAQASQYANEEVGKRSVKTSSPDYDEFETFTYKTHLVTKSKIEALQKKIQVAQQKIWLLTNTIDKYTTRIEALKPKLDMWGQGWK